MIDHRNAPVCLSVAGFDPSGASGVLADIQTFEAFGCVPAAAITSLTFQNDRAVFGTSHQTAATIRGQIEAVASAFPIAAVKTGMLPTVEIVREVARLVREKNLPPPVIDPVLKSTSGFELMGREAVPVLLNELMPLARIITPNVPEAEELAGIKIDDEQGMRDAARKLREAGAPAVLIKGGHLTGTQAIDVLDEVGCVTVFRGEWIGAAPLRGTGCRLSAAIAASLAKGTNLEEAVRAAKIYVANFIRRARKAQSA